MPPGMCITSPQVHQEALFIINRQSSISGTMMSRLMLNLHEATYIGIYTTREMTRIELDTLWSGALDQPSTISMASHNSIDEETQGA